jgi:mannitol/fructose-specific phosphotransferase system IIA component (Ntr-type)
MFTEDAAGPRANLTPLSSAAAKLPGPLGSVGMIVMALAGCLAFFTTANGGILSASRIPMAMARDSLLPKRFSDVSDRFGTPTLGILLTSGFMVAVIAALRVDVLAKVASTMMLMLFLLVNVAVLILRTSRIQNYRPLFKSPLYPWLQVISIPLYAVLIAGMGVVPLVVTGAFGLLGGAWYWIYVRHRIQTESALLYMVRNALSKVMYRSELESELREIALQRDDVVHDRFDRLIKDCDIVDIPDAITRDELFRRISQVVGERLKLPPERVFQEFVDREKQSTTVIQEGLAIPHIVVEGQNLFEMVLVRCRGGAIWPDQQTPVYTIFALVGSRDERNYHLQALMAIAHIVQEHEFLKRWQQARSEEDLRDVLLLSSRRRH